MATIVVRLTPSSSHTLKILQLEGEEVFGSVKRKQNFAPRSKGDSHRHDCLNFSGPRVEFTLHNFALNGNIK